MKLSLKHTEYAKELSLNDCISEIKRIKSELSDKTPHYFRLSKSRKFATTYNKIGIMLDNNIALSDISNLIPVKIHKQFTFSGTEERQKIKYLQLRVCIIKSLKFFNNGNFYAQTKQELRQLQIF